VEISWGYHDFLNRLYLVTFCCFGNVSSEIHPIPERCPDTISGKLVILDSFYTNIEGDAHLSWQNKKDRRKRSWRFG
jgi:hypothetical protein